MNTRAEISAFVVEEAMSSLKAPVARVAAIDVPAPFNRGLRNMMLPSKGGIIEAVQKVMHPAEVK